MSLTNKHQSQIPRNETPGARRVEERLTRTNPAVESQAVPAVFDNKLVWTVDDVASELKCSRRHVRQLVSEDRIPYSKIGRLVRFSPLRLSEWLRKGGTR
jgi:excisionase family DNA binding protein